MKNFSSSIVLNYQIGRMLDKDFIISIRGLFAKLDNNKKFDNYHVSFVSVIRNSFDTQIVRYALYDETTKVLNISFKKRTKGYVLTFNDTMGNEIVSISAPKFNQISDFAEIYLPNILLI